MIPHHKSCGKLIAKAGLTEIKTILGWVIDLCCFALAMREGRFLRPSHERLAQSTVSSAVSHVCTTFRKNNRPNPTKDDDLQSNFLLQRLYRAFKNKDPKEKEYKSPNSKLPSSREASQRHPTTS
jgi:hypothetical protein